jgi:hypothetical protein
LKQNCATHQSEWKIRWRPADEHRQQPASWAIRVAKRHPRAPSPRQRTRSWYRGNTVKTHGKACPSRRTPVAQQTVHVHKYMHNPTCNIPSSTHRSSVSVSPPSMAARKTPLGFKTRSTSAMHAGRSFTQCSARLDTTTSKVFVPNGSAASVLGHTCVSYSGIPGSSSPTEGQDTAPNNTMSVARHRHAVPTRCRWLSSVSRSHNTHLVRIATAV